MIKKIKAVHISANTFDPLPTKTHTNLIWQELSKCVDQYIVIGRSKENSFSFSNDCAVYLRLLPLIGGAQFYSLLLAPLQLYYLIKEKPDYIVCQCPVLGGIPASIYKVFNKNVVLTVEIHGEHILKPRANKVKSLFEFHFFKFFSKLSFSICDNIRSLSPSMSERIIDVYGIEIKDKIKFIPNRVDINNFKNIKDYSCFNPVPIRIITVGAFSPIKNHIKLIKDLHNTGLDYHLTIVGKGPLKDSYEKVIHLLGLRAKVSILESLSHDELAYEYSRNDVYVHYSLTEGVPRVILEAQACGLPVITTNVGYIKGILTDEENALILGKDEPSLLKAALIKLMLPSNYVRLANAGYENITKNFNSTSVFEKYRNVIQGKCSENT